jgi:hypothetical protein
VARGGAGRRIVAATSISPLSSTASWLCAARAVLLLDSVSTTVAVISRQQHASVMRCTPAALLMDRVSRRIVIVSTRNTRKAASSVKHASADSMRDVRSVDIVR